MKKLLKEYQLNSDMQYYEIIVESVINGQLTQAGEQFKQLPKLNRIAFLKAIFGNWNCGLSLNNKLFFLNLIY